jgi:hypothetical protein
MIKLLNEICLINRQTISSIPLNLIKIIKFFMEELIKIKHVNLNIN